MLLNPAKITINENYELCSECGGKCCKGLPGTVYPDDINELSFDAIHEMLESGRYSIDWWEAAEPIYFLRPATKGKEGNYYDGSWGGECTFLSESGCELLFEERPTGCKALVPNPNHGKQACNVNGLNKRHGVDAWVPHQNLLKSH